MENSMTKNLVEDETDKFLNMQRLPKFTQAETIT